MFVCSFIIYFMLAGSVDKGYLWSSSACAKCSSSGRQWNSQVRPRLDTSASLRAPLAGCSSEYPVYKLGVTVHRCLQGNAPQYLVDCWQSTNDVVSRQRLPSASCHQLMVPRHRRTKLCRRAFSVAGPTAWNSRPDYLRDPSLSEDTFRRSLKTFVWVMRSINFLLTYLLSVVRCQK